MTRRALVMLLIAALLSFACGKYGRPVRVGAPVSAVTADHAADCEDPEHDHEEDAKSP